MSSRQLREPIQQRVPIVETRTGTDVPEHKRCPICWGRDKGVGISDGVYRKASSFLRRYYKCNSCGHTWTKNFTPEQVKSGEANAE